MKRKKEEDQQKKNRANRIAIENQVLLCWKAGVRRPNEPPAVQRKSNYSRKQGTSTRHLHRRIRYQCFDHACDLATRVGHVSDEMDNPMAFRRDIVLEQA